MQVVRNRNIIKFGLYGFLKNLKFFEPFFYLYLLSIGLSYFQIGVILSVREITTYVCEIPTGVIADIWGRKRAMLLCFVFYNVSFIGYYLAGTFWILIPASVVFGIGEAFRLGTHKAIIFDYLDHRGITHLRTQVYGFTRAIAQLGAALSAIGAGSVVILTENYRAGFLYSVIPYALAFGLVLSYPPLPHTAAVRGFSQLWQRLKNHLREGVINLRKIRELRLSLVNSAVYDGAFMAARDYIQPTIQLFVMGSIAAGTHEITKPGNEIGDTVLISGFYLVAYLVSALSSQKSHIFKTVFGASERALNILFLVNAATFLAVAVFADVNLVLVLLAFLTLFAFQNIRRPILLDYLAQHTEKTQRATMLSIDSQLRSMTVIVLAPVLGLIADFFSIQMMFFALTVLLFLLHFTVRMRHPDDRQRVAI